MDRQAKADISNRSRCGREGVRIDIEVMPLEQAIATLKSIAIDAHRFAGAELRLGSARDLRRLADRADDAADELRAAIARAIVGD